MAVTNFSPLLGLALPTTGDLSGTWGATVNDSITGLIDSAVAGTTTLSADADVTLSTTNGSANQARNAVILWTASNGATTRNITAPAQSKAYIVINAGTGSIVIRGSGPTTGVTVASGFKALVAWNGSDFVKVASSLVNLTSDVTGTLPIANGGTGTTSTTFVNLATNVTGTLPVGNGGTGITSFGTGIATFLGTPSSANLAAALTDETGSGSAVFATSPTLVTPILGTPQSATLTNATGLPISSGVSGLGTNVATALAVNIGTAGAPVVNGGVLGTPSSGTLTNATGLSLTTGVTGILPVANGGTATATPSLVQGSGVTITGTWPNQTINATGTGGTVTAVSVASSNGFAGSSSGGGTPVLTLSTSITGVLKGNGTALSAATAGTDYVAPGGALGTPSSGNLTNCTFPTLNQNTSGNAATATTATTATTANATNTSNNFQMNSLGVGTAGSGTAGEIRATNNVTAYYSDDRLKKRLGGIENALDKVRTLDSFYYEANETAQELGYKPVREVGISAQQVQAVLPEVVVPAPIDDKYLTVRYERLVPLLIAAIKELEAKVKVLESK
tara:strand:+ start:313 stop:2007 length:1695 start_codon:yes stop_codon:yes gene_type:complete